MRQHYLLSVRLFGRKYTGVVRQVHVHARKDPTLSPGRVHRVSRFSGAFMSRTISSSSLFALTLLFGLAGCGGGSSTPPPVISVNFVGGNSQTILRGQSVSLSVTTVNDSSGKGVTWSLNGPGSLSKQAAMTVEYDAPATAASNLTATITATDTSDPSKSASDVVTVTPPPALMVSLSPTTASVPLNATQNFTSTVQNDPAGSGLNWTLTQSGAPCSPACGSLSTNNTSDNAANTFTPPATMPSNTSVTLTATSVADASKSVSATITIVLPAIAVALSAASPSVGAGNTDLITAVVSFDPANKGVNPTSWTLSPATGAGTLTNTTTTSALYTPPATPPASDVTVTFTATSASDSTKTGSITVTFAAITVILSVSNTAVEAGSTFPVTAMVNNDPANKGVTVSSWTITPVTGAGTLTNATTTSATYTAPAAPPSSNVQINVSATSASDPTKTGTANFTLMEIALSGVGPSSALLPLNISQNFAITVQNDPANAGVSWTLAQNQTACSPACGTLSAANTLSTTPTTYTAPAALPSNHSVTLTVSSVTDPTKSATATLTLTAGTVQLVPDSIDFGTIKAGGKISRNVVLTNTGSSALTINSLAIGGAFTQQNTCGTSVLPGASCTITVTFGGRYGGIAKQTLSISDNSVDSPQSVTLTGVIRRPGPIAASVLATENTVSAPHPTGSNSVGTRIVDLVDPTRQDPYLHDNTSRELLLRFWYPTSSVQTCAPADYASPLVWSHFSQLLGVPLPEVKTNSCLDAPTSPGAHPVVVFTPGYTATFTDYTFLFEDLASRGYVVVSVDHTSEATAVEFPDGRFVKSVFGSHLGGELRSDEEGYALAVVARLADLTFVLDQLERLNVSAESPFAGKLDTSRVALAGHSLGGLTTVLALQQEPLFKVGIVLDGVMPQAPIHPMSKPLFLLMAGRDQWSIEDCQVWRNLLGPRVSMNLPGAEHIAPSDAVWLAKSAVNTGTLTPEQTVEHIRSNVAAFLDANLRAKSFNALQDFSYAADHNPFASHQSQVACAEK
jgi:dienelactone hydrolase